MKITATWKLGLDVPGVKNTVTNAVHNGLKDTLTDITNDVIHDSPKLTGHNMRSVKMELGPGGEIAKSEGEGAVYSTSGYGGYLETGTVKMGARPYFKPALDRHSKELTDNIRAYVERR